MATRLPSQRLVSEAEFHASCGERISALILREIADEVRRMECALAERPNPISIRPARREPFAVIEGGRR